MTKLLSKCGSVLSVIYNKLGDPRSKNALIFILMLLTAFGMVAPDVATNLRDSVLKMAL
jgi:hypothetical protein